MASNANSNPSGADPRAMEPPREPLEAEQPPPGAEPHDDDDGPPSPPGHATVQWATPLVNVVNQTYNAAAIEPFVEAIESLLGASGVITGGMFASRVVQVGEDTMIMRQTFGANRVTAIRYFAEEILAAAPNGSGHTLDRSLLCSLLDSLLQSLAPEPQPVAAVAGSPGRRSTSDGQARALAATMVTEVANENRRQREMPVKEIEERTESLVPVLGICVPTQGDLGHRQQCKYAKDELEGNNDIPRANSMHPLKMCDQGDLAKKPGKEEDIEGHQISCLLSGRIRVRRYVNTCMVAVAMMPECEEICKALLAFDKAVQAASNITTFQQLQEAVDDAMQSAMRARDGECESKKSLAESYQAAARAIMNRNAAIGVMISYGGTPPKKRGRENGDRSPKTEWTIKVGDKLEKFKVMAGGNPNCPKDCTRPKCKKGSMCAFNHKNKE